jgi:single-strand DNA-binding protein
MPNLNKVMLMGNLTRDVEIKTTPSNQTVGNIGLAINRRWRTPDGEQREETTFVDCEAWGKTAETMAKYLSKGRPVYIEGRLKLDQWEDKDGGKRSKMRVVVEEFQFIDSKPGGGGGSGGDDYQSAPRQSYGGGGGGGGGGGSRPAPQRQAPQSGGGGQSHAPMGEEDIPF